MAAVETVKKYGKERVTLLNHNISPEVEHKDIKRFKNDLSNYLDLPVLEANMDGWETKTPLRVCEEIGAFKVDNGTALCTNRLKTEPFHKWLRGNYPVVQGTIRDDVTIVYGFDKEEPERIQRRIGTMAMMGYRTSYPLALWPRTIEKIEDIGISRPITYKLYRHANCQGCLKAGKQQWYLTYCLRPDLWEEAKKVEGKIGYSILKKNVYLEDVEKEFCDMKYIKNICPSEKTPPATFWSQVNKIMPGQISMLPCDCAV